ncbi:HEAT repeat protein [Rhodococcus sp. 27YEA15]|uniref:HEAT repeat domain-containing protein n=1 Tax=Rhodococcus sp. 27YEA15 TaxID=3156259 RepID=UPI003C7ECD71
MNTTNHDTQNIRLHEALAATDSSVRLKAALVAGTAGDPGMADVLVLRCALEPDFFVRDMLTWALTRLPVDVTIPRLLAELSSGSSQARSQSLHTLSKIGDRTAWPTVVTFVHDGDAEVARSAWRASVALVPIGGEAALAAELVRELGRGDRQMQLSLSRALASLDDDALPVLAALESSADPLVRAHAAATVQLCQDPESGFDPSSELAKRISVIGVEG